MPKALKIFLSSLLFGLAGGYAALRLSFWIVERWYQGDTVAAVLALIATGSIGVATAVTAGVLMGKAER